MPLLTTDTWHVVTFLPLSKGPWKALEKLYLSAPMLVDMLKGQPMMLYVASSQIGLAYGHGGSGSGLDDSLIESSIPVQGLTITMEGDDEYKFAKDKIGNLYMIVNDTLRRFPPDQAAALKAFL